MRPLRLLRCCAMRRLCHRDGRMKLKRIWKLSVEFIVYILGTKAYNMYTRLEKIVGAI